MLPQDKHLIIEPQRVTDYRGAVGRYRSMEDVELPSKGETYHVFQIGQINPEYLGLNTLGNMWETQNWQSISSSMNDNNTWLDIYTEQGIQIPRGEVFTIFTRLQTLLMAVKANSKVPVRYGKDKIYLRTYRNAYHGEKDRNVRSKQIYSKTYRIRTSEDMHAATVDAAFWRDQVGYLHSYHNGLRVDTVVAEQLRIGDVVDLAYDNSFKRVVKFPITSIDSFQSELDSVRKYLLHYAHNGERVIEYHDDIDVYIMSGVTNAKGVYYHKNSPRNIRMVTHQDYSIPVDMVKYYSDYLLSHNDVTNKVASSYQVCIFIRHSGRRKPLVFETNKIHELYKLPDRYVKQVLLGVDSVADIWKASYLEKSEYSKLMHSRLEDFTVTRVMNAYGYNAISKLIAESSKIVYQADGVLKYMVPIGCRDFATVFEYDGVGKLLTWYPMQGTVEGQVSNPSCAKVEILRGEGTANRNGVFTTENEIYVGGLKEFDLYVSTDSSPKPISSTTCTYSVSNLNTLSWTKQDPLQRVLVRDLGKFLVNTVEISVDDMVFPLVEDTSEGSVLLEVPYGRLDVFIDGNVAIEDLDYVVRFPNVYVIGKQYLRSTGSTPVTYRCHGYSATGEHVLDQDAGFVTHGTISSNKYFNLRDDKVLNVSVGGGMMLKEQLRFSEFDSVARVDDILNGKPYRVVENIIPVYEYCPASTRELRELAKEKDSIVESYLDKKITDDSNPLPSVIPDRWKVHSPFLNALSEALIADAVYLAGEDLSRDSTILKLSKPFEHFLRYDVIGRVDSVDHQFVVVEPTLRNTISELRVEQYSFLQRAVDLYSRFPIDITPFFTITQGD